jgi:hypothetical protein
VGLPSGLTFEETFQLSVDLTNSFTYKKNNILKERSKLGLTFYLRGMMSPSQP